MYSRDGKGQIGNLAFVGNCFDDMTLQIGFVTSEGVLLATDRQYSNPLGFEHGSCSPKIHVHEKENLAYCSAGDMLCEEFIKQVRKENSKKGLAGRDIEEVRDTLTKCTDRAKIRERKFRAQRIGQRQLFGGNTFIVYRGKDSTLLWSVATADQNPHPTIIDVDSPAKVAGINSSAVFFLDRYFNKVPKKIATLLPLAVHTILTAKCESVKRVQVGVFTRSEFGILPDDELKPLVKLSRELSRGLDSAVLKQLREHQRERQACN